jgi:two-component system sensor histidine kinase KdpD
MIRPVLASSMFGRVRPAPAAALAVAMSVALTTALVPLRTHASRATPALVLVIPIVVAGLAGGRRAAAVAAVSAAAAFNLAFIPPYWTLKIASVDDIVALAVFSVVAASIGTIVAREGERRQALEDRAEELARVNAEITELQEERQRLADEAMRATVLARVDEQRAALLRSVSHDLRTPLSSIRAVASDLLSEVDYDAETTTRLLRLVADEAERLDRLVANLLSMSRIEAGALQPSRDAVPMDEIAELAVKRLERLLRGVRVELDFARDLPLAAGDYTQIDQVVSNLLENAARHAPPGSTVRVGGTVRGETIEVWVDDEGPGVAPFEQRRIFEPFQRGTGSASSGIGLAICKAIVEAHGGEIAATTAPTGGARFVFRLPRFDA